MSTYGVDRYRPGVTGEKLLSAQRNSALASRRYSAAVRKIRYLRSVCIPNESKVQCMFESDDPDTGRELDIESGPPFTRVSQAFELRPSSLPTATRSLIILAAA